MDPLMGCRQRPETMFHIPVCVRAQLCHTGHRAGHGTKTRAFISALMGRKTSDNARPDRGTRPLSKSNTPRQRNNNDNDNVAARCLLGL